MMAGGTSENSAPSRKPAWIPKANIFQSQNMQKKDTTITVWIGGLRSKRALRGIRLNPDISIVLLRRYSRSGSMSPGQNGQKAQSIVCIYWSVITT